MVMVKYSGRSVELGGSERSFEVNNEREVGRGDREVLERSIELDDAGRSLEVNDEAGKADFVSLTDDVGVGRKRTGKHSPKT